MAVKRESPWRKLLDMLNLTPPLRNPYAGTLRLALRQRPQRRRLAGCARPGDCPLCRARHPALFFRADAAYASPAISLRLEEAGYFYAIRLPANAVMRERISHRLTRPVGRPSRTKVMRFYEDFGYQAASWDKPRRMIAKIEWHPGELFPRVGFIVTNLPMEPDWGGPVP